MTKCFWYWIKSWMSILAFCNDKYFPYLCAKWNEHIGLVQHLMLSLLIVKIKYQMFGNNLLYILYVYAIQLVQLKLEGAWKFHIKNVNLVFQKLSRFVIMGGYDANGYYVRCVSKQARQTETECESKRVSLLRSGVAHNACEKTKERERECVREESTRLKEFSVWSWA